MIESGHEQNMALFIMSLPEVDPSLKKKFAEHYVRFKYDNYDAGMALYPNDRAKALFCAVEWVKDPEVIDEVERIKALGNDLPSKTEFLRKLWEITNESKDTKEKLQASKLYADVAGFIEKPAQAQIVNNNQGVVVPKMINAPNFSLDDWQKMCSQQQDESLANADNRE